MDRFEENKIILHSYLNNVIGRVELFNEDAENCKESSPGQDIGKKKILINIINTVLNTCVRFCVVFHCFTHPSTSVKRAKISQI